MPFTFNFSVLFDLSKADPQIIVTNTSIATADEAGVVPVTTDFLYSFKVTTPAGIAAYDSGGVPDIAGDWNSFTLPVHLPLVNGRVEWGGDGYVIGGTATDAQSVPLGNMVTKNVSLCRPPGNTTSSRNNYGTMQLLVEVRCDLAKVYIEEATDYTYQELQGATAWKKIQVVYPVANAGDTPKTYFNASAFSTLLIPLYYDGQGYQLLAESVRDYPVATDVTVRIKYLYKTTFNVSCFVDLACLIRAVADYKQSLIGKTCTMQERINLEYINTDLALLNLIKLQPLCGLDIVTVVERIKELLGSFYSPCPCNNGLYPSIAIPGDEVVQTGVYKQTITLTDSDVQYDPATGILTCDRIAGFDPVNTLVVKDNSLLLVTEYAFDGTFELLSHTYTPGITFTFFGPKTPLS